jgi:hypothetical protein
MKAFLGVILTVASVSAMGQGYQAGTLEALQYLNNEWVEKPNQRAHEREMMRIRTQGSQGYQRNALESYAMQPVCQVVPQYSYLDGAIIGYRKVCY